MILKLYFDNEIPITKELLKLKNYSYSVLRKSLTYSPLLIYLVLLAYGLVVFKSPVTKAIQWIAYTSTVVNATLTLEDVTSQKKHQLHSQDIAIYQLEKLQQIDQELPDDKEQTDVQKPKKKHHLLEVFPILKPLEPFFHAHQFNYSFIFEQLYRSIHAPPPRLFL